MGQSLTPSHGSYAHETVGRYWSNILADAELFLAGNELPFTYILKKSKRNHACSWAKLVTKSYRNPEDEGWFVVSRMFASERVRESYAPRRGERKRFDIETVESACENGYTLIDDLPRRVREVFNAYGFEWDLWPSDVLHTVTGFGYWTYSIEWC